MPFELTVKNYRCFPDANQASLSFDKGFTALVGANNSGKSSILRFLYEFRSLFQSIRRTDPNPLLQSLKGDLSFNKANSISDMEEVFSKANGRALTIEAAFAPDKATEPPIRLIITVRRNSNSWTSKLESRGQTYALKDITIAGTELRRGDEFLADISRLFDAFELLGNSLYIGPFRNAINVGGNEDYFDIKVGEAFIKEWRKLKTGDLVRENEIVYGLTRDIERIFGFKSLEINASINERTLQLFIEGKSFKLPTVGSGLTQFILVLANAAIRKPSYILIDEPELNLHPSLQLDFLTTLASYATEGVIFATHSIGLARASAEKIYSFRRIEEGVSEVKPFEATTSLSEFLGELSFSGYQALGFEQVLLVEGTTDVLTIQQFLRQLRKDHKIVLIPMGGGSMIHGGVEIQLHELKRISLNIAALIDSERVSVDAPLDKNRKEFVDACKKAGVHCHVLTRRAMDHYLSESAIQAVKGPKYRALGHYQDRESLPLGWAKSENWQIARKMDWSELEETDLGKFLASL